MLAMPSLWGLLTWGIALFVYLFMEIGWAPPSINGLLALFGMLFCFLSSFIFFSSFFKSHFNRHFDRIASEIRFSSIVLLHLVGLSASALFIFDMNNSGYLSEGFFYLFITDPLEIRAVPLNGLTRGIFLGYVGWLAVFMSAVQISTHKKYVLFNIILFIAQLMSNLVFLNKIRPVAVILIFLITILIMSRKRGFLKLSLFGLFLLLLIVFFFLAWSHLTGKTFAIGAGYSPAIETFLLYLTSGPAYISHIIVVEDAGMTLARIFRPFYQLSSMFFGTVSPPSNITPFYDLPMRTNVGTALEPWYRDLGATGVFIGMIVLSFGVDLVAYIGLRFGRRTGLLLVVIMCYCSIFAFFAPRLTTGPVFATISLFIFHAFFVLARRIKAFSP